MFQLSTNPATQTYLSTVRVEMPGDNGKKKTNEFNARFKRLSQSELDDLSKRLQEGEVNDAGVINEVMVGWDGVKDESGNDVEFNADNLAALLDVHPVRPTLVKAFFVSVYGAATKN